ncbi:unnamed protein product [Zymoseptoria tritici ST99CH_1E4]|uniref:Brl1/Brr6 domain-containing protein n=1 Tax=Zymoseptoria tritici ST99CH_1E4 TaxID=1276532 RepID=A0A2H1G3H9_ZYMTR|nr:unnamed protein product [Zymoseptoria tritici ST99CH_1E4]
MTFRGNESGMDFEYQNRTGPLDMQSPFAKLAQQHQQRQKFAPNTGVAGTKRPYNVFDSPQKSSLPSQYSPSKPLPPTPSAFNGLFNTPRKMNVDLDDSSAGETPRSPEHDDSTTATPERKNSYGNSMGFRTTATKLFAASNMQTLPSAGEPRGSPVREKDRERMQMPRRDSWIVRLKDKLSNSPGRGEIHRPEHSGAVEKRVKKKRDAQIQRQVSRRRRHSVSDTGEDSDAGAKKRKLWRSPRKNDQRHSKDDDEDDDPSRDKKHWLSSFFTFIAQHPTVPHILSFYAQLAFNVFLLMGTIYVLWSIIAAFRGDVDKKSFEATAEILAESAACLKEWTINRCAPDTRLPALEAMCNSWEKCMNRDPSKIARASLSARTLAEIYNELIEPISWKAMIFTFVIIVGCFTGTNVAFSIFRDKASHPTAGVQNHYYPPPTPSRTFSGLQQQVGGAEGGGGGGYYWQGYGGEPGPSGFARLDGGGEGEGSPKKVGWK